MSSFFVCLLEHLFSPVDNQSKLQSMESLRADVRRASPFGVNGPYIGSLYTTSVGIPPDVKKVMRAFGMMQPWCLACGDRRHRMDSCQKVTDVAQKEKIAFLGRRYAAHLLGSELTLYSQAFDTQGYFDYAIERWRGKRVSFQSLLAFARTGGMQHPADAARNTVGQSIFSLPPVSSSANSTVPVVFSRVRLPPPPPPPPATPAPTTSSANVGVRIPTLATIG